MRAGVAAAEMLENDRLSLSFLVFVAAAAPELVLIYDAHLTHFVVALGLVLVYAHLNAFVGASLMHGLHLYWA